MKLSHHLEKITSVWARKWYWFRGLKCVLRLPFKALHFLQQHFRYSFSVNWGRGGWHGQQALSSALFSPLFFFFLKITLFEITQLPRDLSLVGWSVHSARLRFEAAAAQDACWLIVLHSFDLMENPDPVSKGPKTGKVISKAKFFWFFCEINEKSSSLTSNCILVHNSNFCSLL